MYVVVEECQNWSESFAMDMGKLTSYVIFLLVLYLVQRNQIRTVCPLRAKNCSWNRADQRDIDGVRHHESFEGVSCAPAD